MADIPTIETVKLTAKGLRLLAKVQAGALSQFTRAAIGDGFMPDDQDVAGLTAMISEIPSHQTGEEATSATVDITRITHGEGTVTLRIKIKNGDMSFYLRELGIMAQDPDEGEILYAYINFGDGASAMPAFDGSTYVSRNIDLTFIVSNTANVNANVTLPAEVSYEEFENAMKEKVDKTQFASTKQVGVIRLQKNGEGANISGLNIDEQGNTSINVYPNRGTAIQGNNLVIFSASAADIDNEQDNYKPITPATIRHAVNHILDTDGLKIFTGSLNDINDVGRYLVVNSTDGPLDDIPVVALVFVIDEGEYGLMQEYHYGKEDENNIYYRRKYLSETEWSNAWDCIRYRG